MRTLSQQAQCYKEDKLQIPVEQREDAWFVLLQPQFKTLPEDRKRFSSRSFNFALYNLQEVQQVIAKDNNKSRGVRGTFSKLNDIQRRAGVKMVSRIIKEISNSKKYC